VAKVEGVQQVRAFLREREREAKEASGVTVAVGFSTGYAIYVHENLTAHHPVGQAKFLEEPARTMAAEIGRVVREAWAKTRDMGQALLMGGLRLQREAQIRCPVDTGALKNSAFTVIESK
jgi:uncharacterized membrane protein YdfJ with MMPL/SSD domain